jgi:hypothetical protein
MKITKKAFREYLNSFDDGEPTYRNGRYHSTKRAYGDYLYAQDPEMFNVQFKEWKVEQESKQS